MEQFVQDFGAYAGAVAIIIVAAERLVRLTPTKRDDAAFDWLRGILRVLALDVPKKDTQ